MHGHVPQVNVSNRNERIRWTSWIEWIEEGAALGGLIGLFLLLWSNPNGLPERPHACDVDVGDVSNDSTAFITRIRLDVNALYEL